MTRKGIGMAHTTFLIRAAVFVGALIVSGCDTIAGAKEETEYSGSLSGQFVQVTDHGNSVRCTSTHAVNGNVNLKVSQEGPELRGSGQASWVAPAVSVAGDTLFCRLAGTPPLTGFFSGNVTGTADAIRWSQTQSENTATSSSTQSLSFTGRVSGNVLSGDLEFSQQNRRTVTDCDPTRGCSPPRTVTSTVAWTTGVTASSR